MTQIVVSIAEAARQLNIHKSTLSRQIRTGQIRSHDGGVVIREVIEDRARHVADPKGPKPGKSTVGASAGDLTAERTRLAAAQADAQEVKNAIARRDLVEAVEVEREWADVLRLVKSGLLALPSRVRQRLPHLTPSDIPVLEREVREVLKELGDDKAD